MRSVVIMRLDSVLVNTEEWLVFEAQPESTLPRLIDKSLIRKEKIMKRSIAFLATVVFVGTLGLATVQASADVIPGSRFENRHFPIVPVVRPVDRDYWKFAAYSPYWYARYHHRPYAYRYGYRDRRYF
jgi:hypothetical protein